MSRDRTVEERVADWYRAFEAIKAEITPNALRVMMTQLTNTVPPEGADDLDQVRAYIERVNAAAGVSRLVFENDRTAAIVAEGLTRYAPGRSRDTE